MSARAACAGVLVVLSSVSCGSANSYSDPDPGETVLLVTIEGISRDRLDLYGAEEVPMPVLSEIAAGGSVYEGLVPASTGANASLASLITGLDPREHGVGSMRTLGGSRLAADHVTVAEEYQRAGWRTVAAVSQARLSAEVSGFEQGFDIYDAPPISSGTRPRGSGATVDALLGTIYEEVGAEEPLFAWLHLADLDSDRPAEASWCEPWLHRHLSSLAAVDEVIAAALAKPPGEVFESLREITWLGGRKEFKFRWSEALHDAALERQDYAIGRTLSSLVSSGREGGLRVIVCGAQAGGWEEPWIGGQVTEWRGPCPGPLAPLIDWIRGEEEGRRCGGLVRGSDAHRLLLDEEPPRSGDARVVVAELTQRVRLVPVPDTSPIEVRARPNVWEPLEALRITHPEGRAGQLKVSWVSAQPLLRGPSGELGYRRSVLAEPGEELSIQTETRYPQLRVRLEGEGVDERAVRLGALPMETSDIGVLSGGSDALWPAGDESWLVDYMRDEEDPSLSLLRVAAEAGATRLVLEDAADLDLGLAALEGVVEIVEHPILMGALVVTGVAPFTLEVRGVRPSELALAAFAGGVRVPTRRMRHTGRVWGGVGVIEWLISGPAWTAHARPGLLDAGAPDPDRVVVDFPYRIPDDRVIRWPGPEERSFARRLDMNE